MLLPLLVLLVVSVGSVSADLSSDRAALLAFYNAVGSSTSNRHLSWNRSSGPCNWRGIECGTEGGSSQQRVIKIRLPGVGLVGTIPPQTLGALTSLRVLSLRSNRLNGSFPDLSNCTELRALYLQNNRFSGGLPLDFTLWPQLKSLNLAFNNLNGSISASISSLHRLSTLLLDNNTLSGSLAPQLSIPNLVRFSIANNNITGSVPRALQKFPASSFLGNPGICGPPLAQPCTVPPSPAPAPTPTTALSNNDERKHKKHRHLSAGAIAGIVIGSVVGALLLLLLCCCLFARRRNRRRDTAGPAGYKNDGGTKVSVRALASYKHQQQKPPAVATTSNGGSKDHEEDYSSSVQGDLANKLVFFDTNRKSSYDLEDLLRASAEVLGKGSIGTTYKAVLEDGSVVAVKRLKDVVTPRDIFERHVHQIGSFKHRNVVPLRAYYYSKDEKLLVSDYMPRGSLSALLHGNRGAGRAPLDWPSRVRIAYGAAKGLAYIHEHNNVATNDPGAGFVHGSIKSSNILLAKDFEACVSDAGLIHLLNSNSASPSTRMLGYRAPEVAETRKPTQKSDVYSFGVLLLELLTGRAPNQASASEEGIDLPRWVQSVVREEWTAEVFDLELMRYQNIEEDLVQMLQLAMSCTSASPDHRPSMKHVVQMIADIGRQGDQASDRSDERSTSDIDSLHGQ